MSQEKQVQEMRQVAEKRRNEFLARLKRLSTGERTALKRSLGMTIVEAKADAQAAFFKAYHGDLRHEWEIYFLVACGVCAFHEKAGTAKNFVDCLKVLYNKSKGIEKRFLALLDTSRDDYGYFIGKLGGMLRMALQKELNVDFSALLQDLLNWDYNSRYVQLKWARDFFGGKENDDIVQDEKEDETNAH